MDKFRTTVEEEDDEGSRGPEEGPGAYAHQREAEEVAPEHAQQHHVHPFLGAAPGTQEQAADDAAGPEGGLDGPQGHCVVTRLGEHHGGYEGEAEAAGYIEKERRGRENLYRITESGKYVACVSGQL